MERNDTATQSEETASVPLTRVDQALTSFNLTGFGGTRHVSEDSRAETQRSRSAGDWSFTADAGLATG